MNTTTPAGLSSSAFVRRLSREIISTSGLDQKRLPSNPFRFRIRRILFQLDLGSVFSVVEVKRAFEASSAASLIGAILEREPAPLVSVQPLAPTGLDRLVRQCLAKSPDDRPDTAHDLANDLRFVSDDSGVAPVAVTHPGSTLPRAIRSLALLMAGAALASGIWWLWVLSHTIASPPESIRAEISVQPAEELNAGGVESLWIPTAGGSRTALTWTPDGHSIIFVGRRRGVQQLYARPLDATEAHPLAGTDGAQVPAVSPDGRWVCFWAAGAIRKVSLAGGPVMELVSGITLPPNSLLCQNSGRAFFGKSDGIWQAQAGEAVRRLTNLGDAERAHIASSTLPGDQTLLYTVRKRAWSWGDEEVVALDLSSGRRAVLLHDAADARYVVTSHLVFLRRGGLFAVPFDTAQVTISGPEVLLLEGISQALKGGNAGDLTGRGQFTISASGSLAWIPAATAASSFQSVLVAVDRRGHVAPLGSPAQNYSAALRVSPDGHRMVVTIRTLTESGLWVYDLDRKGILMPLHRGDEAGSPVWSPDGQHIAFNWLSKGQFSFGSQLADGTRPPKILTKDRLTLASWVSADRVLGVREEHLVIANVAKSPRHCRAAGRDN
jgi:hypothetical protein